MDKMTEQMAIQQLNFDMEMIRFDPDTGESFTLEQIKAHNEDNYKTYIADEMAITALLEIQQYRAIGTVEDFKALKEKSVAKKAIVSRKHHESYCPNCKEVLTDDEFWALDKYLHHCNNCGQAIQGTEYVD